MGELTVMEHSADVGCSGPVYERSSWIADRGHIAGGGIDENEVSPLTYLDRTMVAPGP